MRSYSLCERNLVTHRAGAVEGRLGAVDGRLTVTSARVVFEPTAAERLLGKRGWTTFHDEVADIELRDERPRGWRNWRAWRHVINTGGGPVVSITDATGTTRRLVSRRPRKVLVDLRCHTRWSPSDPAELN